MFYYVDISNTAVKIDSYEPTEFLLENVEFFVQDFYFSEVAYDTTTSWYIPNYEQ